MEFLFLLIVNVVPCGNRPSSFGYAETAFSSALMIA